MFRLHFQTNMQQHNEGRSEFTTDVLTLRPTFNGSDWIMESQRLKKHGNAYSTFSFSLSYSQYDMTTTGRIDNRLGEFSLSQGKRCLLKGRLHLFTSKKSQVSAPLGRGTI
jgi:hypothetical protein